MTTTKPNLVCPIDGFSQIILTPLTVGANDFPQSVQWQCITDLSHNGIVQAGGTGKITGPGTGTAPLTDAATDYLTEAILNFFTNPPEVTTSKNFQIDDGGIYIQRTVKTNVANIAPLGIGPPSVRAFDTSVPVANGMSMALNLLNSSTLVGGVLFFDISGRVVVDFYEAYTSTINNYDFYEPRGFRDVLLDFEYRKSVGASPGIVKDLHDGTAPGPYVDPPGVFDSPNSKGIGIPQRSPLNFGIRPPYGGIRLAAHYIPGGNDPPYAFSHWIQVVGDTNRNTLVTSFGDDLVTEKADSLGLFWAMDNANLFQQHGDPLDPFYDTPHFLGADNQSHTTATPQWFVDTPTISVALPNSFHVYGLFIGYWVDANGKPTDRRQPVTYTAKLVDPPSYFGFNKGAHTTDDTFGASPPFTGQLMCGLGPKYVLFGPAPLDAGHNEVNAAIAANAATLINCPGDGGDMQIGVFQNVTPVPNPLIAISTQGHVYGYLNHTSVKDRPEKRLILRVPFVRDGLAAIGDPVPQVIDVFNSRANFP